MKPPRVSFDEALSIIAATRIELGCETLETARANGRILAAPLFAQTDSPPFDMSAMDGYAIGADYVAGTEQRRLRLGEPLFAGMAPLPLEAGAARPIFTGAAVPHGTGAVLVQERAILDHDTLLLAEPLISGSNIRRAGEDARAGDKVLESGRRIHPATIGALHAYGIMHVPVRARPRVAMLILGDEIGGSEARAIPDSNGPMIAAMLADAGCDVLPLVPVDDNERAITEAFDRHLDAGADIILSTGGASVGAKDFLRRSVEAIGATILFHGVHMRPGKPVLFATSRKGVPIFGLPGNPAAALVAARFFVMAAIRIANGRGPEAPLHVDQDSREPGPLRVLKAHARRAFGGVEVKQLPGQESHRLRPLLQANSWWLRGGGRPAMLFPLFDRLEDDGETGP
ncbi:MAG: molybdopterin molybdotransferase MoeA [Pseudomonadota bacterium]